jgi:DNA polymerase-3 subunit delta
MAVSGQTAESVRFICGADDFTVKQRAREVFQQWCASSGGFDQDIIDASVANSGEALRALSRLCESLQSLPFFGSVKITWFKDCNFLGDDRTAESQAVTEHLADLAAELKQFKWTQVRLLISAGKVDKRKLFYKTLEKIGPVEIHEGLSTADQDWAAQAEAWAEARIRERKKEASDEALSQLVDFVGPNLRQLSQEIEKLVLYTGQRTRIETRDVDAIVTRQKQAQAFALGEALGDRHLPRVLRALEDELWGLKSGSQKSEIGVLYGLITKIRVLLFLNEMMRQGWIKPDANYSRFKAQLENIPQDWMPADKRINPLAMHPYVLFKALAQTRHYSPEELIHAMELLLECNRRLIFSDLDPALVLQQTLIEIVQRPGGEAIPSGPRGASRRT